MPDIFEAAKKDKKPSIFDVAAQSDYSGFDPETAARLKASDEEWEASAPQRKQRFDAAVEGTLNEIKVRRANEERTQIALAFNEEWARSSVEARTKRPVPKVNINDPADLERMVEYVNRSRERRAKGERASDPGFFFRAAGEPLRVMSGGTLDPAKEGEFLAGGSGRGVDRARAEAGIVERIATGVAGVPGYLAPVGKAAQILAPLGRAALPVAMGTVSAGQAALAGEDPLKAGISGAIQGTVAQAIPIPQIAGNLLTREAAARGAGALSNMAGEALGAAATGQDVTPERLGQAAAFGALMPGQRTPVGRPTPARAGEAIAKGVQKGVVDIQEVASREVLAAVEAGRPVAEAVLEPRPVRPDGSRGDGYDPDALAKGKVEPGAVEVVQKAEAEVGPVVSSGQESPVTGKPWALAVDRATGEPVRVDGEAVTSPESEIVKFDRVEDLDAAVRAEVEYEKGAEVRAFGVEGAKRWASLHRAANSADHARADAAQREIDAIEAGMTPAQKREVFGIGQTRPTSDDIRSVRQRADRLSDPEYVGRAIGLELESARGDTLDAQTDYLLRYAVSNAEANGISREALTKQVVDFIGTRHRDPADAAFMLEKVAELMGARPKRQAELPRPALVSARKALPEPRVEGYQVESPAAKSDADLPEYLRNVKVTAKRLAGPMRAKGQSPDVVEYSSGGLKAPVEAIVKGAADEFRSMASRLRAEGNVAEAARMERTAAATRAEMGRLSPWLTRALRVTGDLGVNPLSAEARAARRVAAHERVQGKDYYVSKALDESGTPLSDPAEQRIMEAMTGLSRRRWKMAQLADIRRENPQTGVMEPLPDSDGRVKERLSTDFRTNILRAGKGSKHWDALVEAHADRDGILPSEAETRLDAEAEAKGLRGEARTKEAAFEHRRWWKDVPSALVVDGMPRALYETNPAKWARRTAEEGAQRLGFVKTYGQDFYIDPATGKRLYGVPGPVSQAEQAHVNQGGNRETFVEASRTASARPATQPGARDSKAQTVADVLRWTWGKALGLKFSATPFLNPLEPGGVAVEQAGVSNTMKAAFDVMGDGINRLFGGNLGGPFKSASQRISALERSGAARVERPSSSQRYVNLTAAGGARRFADQMAAGKVVDKARAAARLEASGIDAATAKRMAAGQGTKAEYDAWAGGAASRATGSGMTGVERTRLESRPVARVVLAPLNYATRQLRQTAGVIRTLATAGKNAAQHPLTPASWNRLRASTQQAATYALGRTAVGAGQYLLMSLLMGGPQRLGSALAEMQDDPEGFFGRSFAQSIFSGGYGAFLRAASSDQDLGSAILPLAVARETVQAFAGTGFYEDMALGERMLKLTKSLAPIVKIGDTAIATAAEAFGNPQHERKFAEAKRALSRWRGQNDLKGGVYTPGDEDRTFTLAMRRAYRAMLEKDNPEAVKAGLEEAFGLSRKGTASLAASLQLRRIFNNPKDPLIRGKEAEIRKAVGQENYDLLLAHDALIDNMVAALTGKAAKSEVKPKVDKEKQPFPAERVKQALGGGSK